MPAFGMGLFDELLPFSGGHDDDSIREYDRRSNERARERL